MPKARRCNADGTLEKAAGVLVRAAGAMMLTDTQPAQLQIRAPDRQPLPFKRVADQVTGQPEISHDQSETDGGGDGAHRQPR
ncbi:hypothetical protein BN2475_190136 [Paraburkholderia ribeironis]|uniref:Uncharacterized protein n=1 Tax=Paraburkholderia ribeironis TaxID=1247936 RepID=A0A1N7RVU0_9BURK|nr:hypothetical protein BN2475_190136 [Paraburkholderia ribeironis]